MSLLLSVVVSFLMLAGAACALLAAVGILRMPDLFTRLQASSKAATLGAILVLSAVAVHFQGGPVAVKAVVVILFLALTAPVGAHRIARAAYSTGERMADSDSVDEWAELRVGAVGLPIVPALAFAFIRAGSRDQSWDRPGQGAGAHRGRGAAMTTRLVSLRESRIFQGTVIVAICVAAVVVGLETYPGLVDRHGSLLRALDDLVLAVFVIEIVVKIASYGRRPWHFFRDGWNVFDFVIVGVCLLPGDAHFAAVLRLARVLRAFRLFSAVPRLQLLVSALLKSLPSMGYVALLLALLFYVYGAMGVFLWGANDPKHFGDLHSSLLSLFRVVTLEDWTDIMYTQMYGSDNYPAPSLPGLAPRSEASPLLAPIYFVSFVLLGTMIVLNLLIGVIINSMTEAQREAEHRSRRAPVDVLGTMEEKLEGLLDEVRTLRHGEQGRAA